MSFFVKGIPIPEGNMIASRYGRVYHKNQKVLNPWRDWIHECAERQFPTPLEGAVVMSLQFILPKPKSVKRDEPFVKPDLDKLVRAVGDALTGVAFIDDAQVTDTISSKRYPINERDLVGVRIEVFTKASMGNRFDMAGFLGVADSNTNQAITKGSGNR